MSAELPLSRSSVAPPRPLPVVVLADVSGSMREYRKIETLNECVATMIRAFAGEDTGRSQVHVAVVTFGNDQALLHQPLAPAAELTWTDMQAAGNTPFGKALRVLTGLVTSAALDPRAFTPTLILVSDGKPTDRWEEPLEELLATPRGKKAIRLAIGVGEDMDDEDFAVLELFIANEHIKPKRADEAHLLTRYFSFVTMSVTNAARSGTGEIDLEDLEDLL